MDAPLDGKSQQHVGGSASHQGVGTAAIACARKVAEALDSSRVVAQLAALRLARHQLPQALLACARLDVKLDAPVASLLRVREGWQLLPPALAAEALSADARTHQMLDDGSRALLRKLEVGDPPAWSAARVPFDHDVQMRPALEHFDDLPQEGPGFRPD